jgi:hypothetical protein
LKSNPLKRKEKKRKEKKRKEKKRKEKKSVHKIGESKKLLTPAAANSISIFSSPDISILNRC